jgi:hypothetical protein
MTPTRRLSLALSAALLAAAPVVAQQEEGYRYTFRMASSDDDEDTRGSTVVLGGRARVDFEREGRPDRDPHYLLIGDGGRTVTIVRPREREYSVMPAEEFERVVGTALRGVEAIVRLEPQNVRFTSEKRGRGPTILGHATERLRLTQRYHIRMRALGFEQREEHEVVTEYFVSPSLRLQPNPVLRMLASIETAVAQQDERFVDRAQAARDALVTGTPLRVVVRARRWDPDDGEELGDGTQERTIEITGYEPGRVDAALLEIPAGYERKEGVSFRM